MSYRNCCSFFTFSCCCSPATETIVDSYPDGTSTKVDQIDRTYTYQDRMLSSLTETSKGTDSKTLTQQIDWYDDLGLYPAAVSMKVETGSGVQTTLFHYYGYDGLGRLTARVYPDESFVTYQYDMLGRPTSEQFTNQDTTRTVSYAYDDSTRQVTTTLPDGSKTFTNFTPFGDVEYKGQVGTDGTVRPLLYNTYSLEGKHLLSSAPYAMQERATTYVNNQDGTVWQKIDPIGTTVYLSANSVRDGQQYVPSQTRLTLHPNGLQNTQYFDRYGQLEKEISRTGDQDQSITTTYERNAFDQVNLKTVMDHTGEQRAWKYRYTTGGNLVYLLDPENNTYQYGYDAYGNLATVTENSKLTTKSHYNAMSWKISEQDVPSGATESYRYFPNGKPASYTDKAGNRHEYAYTPFYDLASLTTKDPKGVIRNKETTEYFANTSLVKKETNSNGPNVEPNSKAYREVQYTYDPFQRLSSLKTYGREYGIGYQDRDDQIDQLTYPGGTVISYHYDLAERLREVSSNLTGTIRYDYHIDNIGESYNVQYPNGRSMETKMDSFGQVTNLTQSHHEKPVWTESNQYAFGNVVQILRNGTAYHYDYDKVDRLTDEVSPDHTKRYSYDQRGNRAAMDGKVTKTNGITSYTFDERNRLRGIANEGKGNEESYTYFGDGLRATKAANGTETKYVYLNGKVIEELDESGNVKARNVWGNELLFRKDYVTNQNGYYGYNSHGDVVSISDEEGNDVNLYDYDTWGNIVSKTEGMSNPFRYSGEIYDEASGFYYLRARYYDPSIGRFISEDAYKGQMDNPLSLNRYTYVSNNPLRYIDPSGHIQCEGAIGGCNKESSGNKYYKDLRDLNYEEQMQILEDSRYSLIDKARVSVLMFTRVFSADKGGGVAVAINASKYAKPVSTLIKAETLGTTHPVLDFTRVGSALKSDPYHAFNNIIDNFARYAAEYRVTGGDGVNYKLYQIKGSLVKFDTKYVFDKNTRNYIMTTVRKDVEGVFEWMVDPNKGLTTHRRFIEGGQITGFPNQVVPK